MIFLKKSKSNIHGIGIFTSKEIENGENFYQIPNNSIFHESKSRCAHIGNNTWISDEEVLNYVNHSCNPNSTFDTEKLVLVASRKINSGEEITLDYNKTEQGNKKLVCTCGDNNCRGYFLIRV